MTAFANNAEGGSNGTAVTQGGAGNSGGASGDFWTLVTKTSGASTCTFSNTWAAHGSLSYAFQMATNESVLLIWNCPASTGSAAGLFYYKHPGTPAATSQIAMIRGAANICVVSVSTANKVTLSDGTGVKHTSTPTLVAGDELWISFRATKGTTTGDGTIEYAWGYKGNATVQGTFFSNTANAGTVDMNSIRFGRSTPVAWATTFYADSLEGQSPFTVLIPAREQRDLTAALPASMTGTATAAGVPTLPGALAPSMGGAGSAAGVPALPAALAPSMTGAGSATGTPSVAAALAPSMAGTATATGTPAITGALAPSLAGTASATGAPAVAGTVTSSMAGTSAAAGVPRLPAAVTPSMVGTGGVTGAPSVGADLTASIDTTVTLEYVVAAWADLVASMVGAGTVDGIPSVPTGDGGTRPRGPLTLTGTVTGRTLTGAISTRDLTGAFTTRTLTVED